MVEFQSDGSEGGRLSLGEVPANAFPLSNAQYGLWLSQQLTPDVPITMAQYVDLQGELDIATAQAELAVMAAQIAALRKYRQKH